MSFKRIYTTDLEFQMLQDNIEDVIKPIEAMPTYSSQLIDGISLIAGQDNIIAHKLKLTPSLFIVANLNANAVIWTQTSLQMAGKSSNQLFINLRCSADCVASIIFK